jgi:hypothetical protein
MKDQKVEKFLSSFTIVSKPRITFRINLQQITLARKIFQIFSMRFAGGFEMKGLRRILREMSEVVKNMF